MLLLRLIRFYGRIEFVAFTHSGFIPRFHWEYVEKILIPTLWLKTYKYESSQFMIKTRIDRRFAACMEENRPALVTFVTAGDPDLSTSNQILKTLSESGSDLIEIGMPFSDPMAEGIPIQLSSQRALNGGQNMDKTFELVKEFRKSDNDTPIVLMGYYNPIYSYGNVIFLDKAVEAGVDGLIVVDLPPEADNELCIPAMDKGISFIRLATPTTDEKRIPTVLSNASGFVYYVSITGITGSSKPDISRVGIAVKTIKKHTKLPVVVGFGIKSPEQAKAIGIDADGIVVGSAIVESIRKNLQNGNYEAAEITKGVSNLVKSFSESVKVARSVTN